MKAALKRSNNQTDLILIVNLYTSFDLLNDEKNAGTMAMYQHQSYAEAEGFRVKSMQRSSSDFYKDAIEVIKEFKVHQVFIVIKSQRIKKKKNVQLELFLGLISIINLKLFFFLIGK